MDFGQTENRISCGTTILAMEFDGGVVIGADSRTSCQYYVTNRVADKLTRLTDKIYCCRSGAAAQTQELADNVASTLYSLELALGEPALVRDAAVQFRNRIYAARKTMLAGMIVAGWDQRQGGQVYGVPITGLLVREPCCVAGSGSTHVNGYLTAHYRPGMNQDEAVTLARNAVLMAIHHDCSTGGVIRIGVINETGMHSRICYHDDPEVLQFASDLLWFTEFGNC
ncbi:proteasome subunit beta type-6 [Drosophila grimshawi]|uniref:proteasome endopeptidase complex n=1 Tax=Drosophila grimshawi TaxID=7222 RepID=B4J6V9_DROGR|nr:proteasome subunit beta type-6 [Drosophila grimshawi]EDW02040.1 GH21772 [Drosophila grimshawi]